MKTVVTLTVRKKSLIDWYFDNWDRHEAHEFLNDVKKELIDSGKFILKVEDIADILGYIPSHILEGEHDVDEYEVWDEIVLI